MTEQNSHIIFAGLTRRGNAIRAAKSPASGASRAKPAPRRERDESQQRLKM